MKKSLSAILAGAAAAAVFAILTAPAQPVTAGPMPQAATDEMHACANRAWPYLRCVGTKYGDPKIRLVTTDKLN